MPRRAAATEPSTTVGYFSSAASRKRPVRTVPPSVSRSERSTACTDRPPVSLLLMRSVRRTDVSRVVAALAAWTGRIAGSSRARRRGGRCRRP